MLTSLLILVASAEPAPQLMLTGGEAGPFALHPTAPRLAVVEQRCDGKDKARMHVFSLPELSAPVRTITLPRPCVERLLWTRASEILVETTERAGSSVQVWDTDTGKARFSLGTRRDWGVFRMNAEGTTLAEIGMHSLSADSGWELRSTFRNAQNGKRESVSVIELPDAARPPTMIAHGLGVLHYADERFWEYDLLEGRLRTSRPAPPEEPDQVLRLIDAAAPGGESLIYVANDFQSGFERPLPTLWSEKLPKKVFSVPELNVVCTVAGVDGLRDFTKGKLGTRFTARPGEEQRAVYQRSSANGPLLAFLMPPKDPFVNPFGSGQEAYVIHAPAEGVCQAESLTALGRDPFWFDANPSWLVVSTDLDAATGSFRGLSAHPIPQEPPPPKASEPEQGDTEAESGNEE